MDNTAVEPKKVFQTIDENLKALSQVDYDNLTKEEVVELREQYESLIELALKIKKKLKED